MTTALVWCFLFAPVSWKHLHHLHGAIVRYHLRVVFANASNILSATHCDGLFDELEWFYRLNLIWWNLCCCEESWAFFIFPPQANWSSGPSVQFDNDWHKPVSPKWIRREHNIFCGSVRYSKCTGDGVVTKVWCIIGSVVGNMMPD